MCSTRAAEAGVVADRDVVARGLGEHRADRLVDPLEVRREAHEAVVRAHQPGHRDADADDGHRRRVYSPSIEAIRSAQISTASRAVGTWSVSCRIGAHDAAAERDHAEGDGIHLGVDGDGDVALVGVDGRARPADLVRGVGIGLVGEAVLAQLGDQGADGGAVEPGLRGERDSRACAPPWWSRVEDGGEVVPPQLIGGDTADPRCIQRCRARFGRMSPAISASSKSVPQITPPGIMLYSPTFVVTFVTHSPTTPEPIPP